MKFSLIALALFASVSCVAQKPRIDSLPQVIVTNWDRKAFMVNDVFWDGIKEELIRKVGSDKFQEIKTFSADRNQPQALLIWDGKTKVPGDEYRKRLSTLVLYEVAGCTRIVDGRESKSTILAIPFQELYWDKNAKWDVVYFIVKTDGVKRKID